MFFVRTAKLECVSARADGERRRERGVLQRIKGILPELRAGCEVANEKADGVAAEGVLQDAGEFRVAVRDTALIDMRIRWEEVCDRKRYVLRLD